MSDKISYILEVNDQYTSSLKDFLSHLDKITDKLKGVGSQEKKNQKARISYAKDQREEFQKLKNWMHEKRMSQTKGLFLERQLSQAKKQTALAEKDSAIAGAINLRTASQRRLTNQRTISDLRLIRVQQEQNINNALKADRMISSRAYGSPSAAFTPIKFNPYEGKYQPILPPQPKQPPQPERKLFGGGVSFGGVAKAVGYYSVIDKAVGLPREIIDTRRQFDALGATLQTVLPSYDKTTSSSQLAANEMEYLIKVVRTLGLDLSATKEEYVKFLAASAGKKSLPQAQKEFESFAKLSTVYGIDPYRFNLVMNAITQMTSKGIVSLEELQRQLGDSLPGAVKLFADSLGLTEPVFRKLVSDGRITAGVLSNVSDYIDKNAQITSGLDVAMQKLGARLNRVSTSWTLLVESLSQGDAGVMINDLVTILDNGIQKLTKSLETMGTVWTGIRQFGSDSQVVFETPVLKQFKDFTKFFLEGLLLLPSAIMDLIKYMGQGAIFTIKGFITKDFSELNALADELSKKWFGSNPQNPLDKQFAPIPQSSMPQQEVIVKIVGENLPTGISIKQESGSYGMTPRPKTVIAGGL